MAKIDFDQVLTDGDGKEMLTGKPGDEGVEKFTLKFVCMGALLTPQPADGQTEGLAYQLYTLAHRLNAGGLVEVEAHQIDTLKRRIERMYGPWTVGRAWDALEGRLGPPETVAI